MSMPNVLLAMILLPLVGAFLNGFVIKTRKTKRAGLLGTFFAAGSFACALTLFSQLLHGGAPIVASFEWFQAGNFTARWGFQFDQLTAVMALVVTGIGSVIHLYSIGYMEEDPTPRRYFAYLNLFLFAMLTLISADSLIVMFVGWEGVGLCSYLLIGYWYQDLPKANAGMKAFLVNRIGDAGFLIGMFLCYQIFGTITFREMVDAIAKVQSPSLHLINLAAFFLFVGACGKSAQIPLFTWLPDAMAGPTPVSALIHAATMVTAGVYLTVRMNFMYCIASDASYVVAVVGGVTALFAATIALAQRDIKKVLAYSTVSQLGLMFLAIGTKNYFGGLFHVVTHAFFKALLFLGAGSVIHALHHEQDIFKMGGLRKVLPFTHFTFLIGTIAICGIPPLAGFFSKDEILFGTLMAERASIQFWLLGSLTSALTAFYMTRLYCLTFLGEYRGHGHPHESPLVMTVPLILLAIGSTLVGLIGMPHGLHLLPNYLLHFLHGILPEHVAKPTPISELGAMGIATGVAFISMGLGFFFYGAGPARAEAVAKNFRPLQAVLLNKYWVDELYGWLFLKPFDLASRFLARFFDPRIVDGAVLLPTKVARAGGTLLSMLQMGAAQFYLLIMMIGLVVMMWIALKGTVI